jgi:uncharacterized membrane protein
LLGAHSPACAAQEERTLYGVEPIPPLCDTCLEFRPDALNDSGIVAGSAPDDSGSSNSHACTWSAATGIIDLGDFPAGGINMCGAHVINELGHTAGSGSDDGETESFLWTPEDGFVGLGSLKGKYKHSLAYGMNYNDWVVGQSHNHAYLWTAEDGMKDLGRLSGESTSYAYAVNTAGVVVGWAGVGYSSRGFTWDAENGKRKLPNLEDGSYALGAFDINESGHVVGQLTTYPSQGFVWHPDEGYTLVGTLDGPDPVSYLWRINDHGVAIGIGVRDAYEGDFTALIWDAENGLRDLNTLLAASVPDEYRELNEVCDINNRGQILAISQWFRYPCLLTPFVLADMNCDGRVDIGDIDPFVLALVDLEEHARTYPDCHGDWAGDANQDGRFDFDDIDAFVELISEGR